MFNKLKYHIIEYPQIVKLKTQATASLAIANTRITARSYPATSHAGRDDGDVAGASAHNDRVCRVVHPKRVHERVPRHQHIPQPHASFEPVGPEKVALAAVRAPLLHHYQIPIQQSPTDGSMLAAVSAPFPPAY